MNTRIVLGISALLSLFGSSRAAAEIKVGGAAPVFKTVDHEGKPFDLQERKGKWTVLYFYPKADTPGCTKQACAYRDSIQKIRDLGAEVFGVSIDTVAAQAAFHKKYQLKFTLLADDKGAIVAAYGSKMPLLNVSKRMTFIIDPTLTIRYINPSVDPVKDADEVAQAISKLLKP